jgi:polysaccharide chain length determinant protein (PEP-CTERM system associated)
MNDTSSMTNVKSMLAEQAIVLWRRKWIALGVVWLAALIGWGGVTLIPRSYESDARAFVDVNGMLTPLLKGLVVDTTAASQTSDYVRQTLLSRPNLEEVIHLAQMDIGINQTQKDSLIGNIANQVTIRAQAKNLFQISYSDSSPARAKNVVDALLTIFAEKAASSNRVEMEKARKFLDDQIMAHEEQLRASEQRRADFRRQYAEMLADPISGQPRLQTLANELNQAKLAYNQLLLQQKALENQLKEVPQFRTVETANPLLGDNGDARGGGNSPAGLLSNARNNLAALRLRYTDQHPDVIAAKNQVASLEAQLVEFNQAAAQAAQNAPKTSDAATSVEPMIKTQQPNPLYEQMRLKLVDFSTTVPAAKQRLDQATEEYNKSKTMTAQIPDIDAKAKDLDRDYDIVKKNHDELIARRESANLSQAADDQADRTQFRIVDPPQVPINPSFPNLPLMFSLVLVMSIGVGLAIPIAIELFRSTFSSALRLRGLGLPVIGAVTYVRRPGATRGFIAGTAGIAVMFGALLVVYGALMVIGTGAYRGIL